MITGVEPDALVFTHTNGSARIPYEKLPSPLQTQYFDPAKVTAIRQQQQLAAAKAAAAQREREEASQKAQHEARRRAEERREHEEAARKAEQEASRVAEEDREREESARRAEQEDSRQAELRQERFGLMTVGILVLASVLLVLLTIWFASAGTLITLIGLGISGYFFFIYDTSVSTQSEYIADVGIIGGQRVHNQGLLQNRFLGCIGGMILTGVGLGISFINANKSKV